MKKLFLAFLLLGAGAHCVQAQTPTPITAPVSSSPSDRTPSIIIKGGGALVNFTGAGAVNNVYRPEFFGGIGVELPVVGNFSILTEGLYSRKGATFTNPAAGGQPSNTTRLLLQYVDVPVLARYHAGGLFFEVGPQVGVLIDAQNQQANQQDQGVLTNYNVLDFGYVGGLGYETAQGLGIGARYNGSFGSILDNASSLPASTVIRNSAFQLYLSFTFRGENK